MNKYYYELLKFIDECPDNYISKNIMFNGLKWTYGKIDAVINDLLDMKCIDEYNFTGTPVYHVNFKGKQFIKDQNLLTKTTLKIKLSEIAKSIWKLLLKVLSLLSKK